MRMCSHHPTRCGRKMGILLVFLVLVLSSAAFAVGPLPGGAHSWRPATSSRSAEELRAPRGDGRAPAPSEEAVKARLAADYGTFPLLFEKTTPTADSPVHFTVRGRDKTLYFTPEGITFSLSMPEAEAPAEKASASAAPSGPSREDRVGALRTEAPRGRWTLKLDFVGAAKVRPEGETKADTVISYFKGKTSEHRTVPTYRRIVYRNLWPGIDLQYAGDRKHLKYQFVVHPGADPAHIRLAYRGADRLAPGSDGGLEIVTAAGTLRDDTPVSWQEVDGARVPVTVTYALEEGENQQNYGFAVAPYDRSKPLVIDPVVLVYCGYIGGAREDRGEGIAVDGAGCAYVTGTTDSIQDSFPVKVGPDVVFNGTTDVFVAKVAADGQSLAYCGYIGGAGDDWGYDIAVDGAGCAYVTGMTKSAQDTFPVKIGPDLTYNGSGSSEYERDAFVAKVAADGTELVYCGYIGGDGDDYGWGIAVDGAGCAYVTGMTHSTEDTFPVKVGPGLTYHDGGDAFVAKVTVSGETLAYCGYIGGNQGDGGSGIAVDGAGCAYVTGTTKSAQDTFPVKVGPDLTYNGGTDYFAGDAFVAKVVSSGAELASCGYIGGETIDWGCDVAVDGAGNAYVTGGAWSTEATFPVKVGPDVTYNGGFLDAFVAKVASAGTELIYCGYIGGDDWDQGCGIAVDGAGNAYVTGETTSTEATFPVKEGPDLAYNGGIYDAFVAKVAASGEELAFCGYIGGAGYDKGLGIALDGLGNAYMTGVTTSTQDTFPVMGGLGTTYAGGNNDAFVAKVGIALACRASLQGHGAGQHAASLAVRLRPAAGGEETPATVFSNREGAFALSPSDGGEWRVVAKERRTLS
ncbi:MAG TPA: SBBP repeat-containing protein, partial [Synergistaceae bacterium]|nr:SBBP repeat-containing protein [Synergistaceae bacterium]